jgi:hypothetical protein
LYQVAEAASKGKNAMNNSKTNNNLLLMCKDTPVYDINQNIVLNNSLIPGCILRKTKNFDEWMQTRYSSGSNPSARRTMLRAFGSDNHTPEILQVTRALSLSDCYWLKTSNENVRFQDVTPYLNAEWNGNGAFKGGSISTLFVNGAANKKWLDSKTLLKIGSFKETDGYALCEELKIPHISETRLSNDGILVTNFTSPDKFLESVEQSGYVQKNENPREKAIDLFGESAVTLFTVDYLVECDDRHWGNYGFIRNANTGAYEGMSPYYDFDWIWTEGIVPLPEKAISDYGSVIKNICVDAKTVANKFEKVDVIQKRADELLQLLECHKIPSPSLSVNTQYSRSENITINRYVSESKLVLPESPNTDKSPEFGN